MDFFDCVNNLNFFDCQEKMFDYVNNPNFFFLKSA